MAAGRGGLFASVVVSVLLLGACSHAVHGQDLEQLQKDADAAWPAATAATQSDDPASFSDIFSDGPSDESDSKVGAPLKHDSGDKAAYKQSAHHDGPHRRRYYNGHAHIDHSGFGAVCNPALGTVETTADGTFQGTTGNLARATVTCSGTHSLQIGGYCKITCRTTDPPGVKYVDQLGPSTGWYSDGTQLNNTLLCEGCVVGPPVTYYPWFRFPPGSTGELNGGTAKINELIAFTNPFPGSLNDDGVMQLTTGNDNGAKTSVRFYKPWLGNNGADNSQINPIAPASDLSSFEATFRWFPASQSATVDVPAFNFQLVTADLTTRFSLAWTDPNVATMTNATWQVSTINFTTPGWKAYGISTPGVPSGSLEQIFADPTFGSLIGNSSIWGVGFNIGTGMPNTVVGIDWLQTTLLNDGNRIDFISALSYPVVMPGGATIGGSSLTDPSTTTSGWTLGPAPPAQTSCFGAAVTTAGGGNTECANTAIATCCAPRG